LILKDTIASFLEGQWLIQAGFPVQTVPSSLTRTTLTGSCHRVMPFRLGPFLSNHAVTFENRFHRTTERYVTSSSSPTQPTTN
ncbi:hypothetical protein, partial [Pseudovibrio sp. W64]|uniref:hypothetical protein n=1 Tax=Pseudovibrio sp. W64 TaxID=1735583 RepID=UPI0019D3AB6A